MEHDLRDRGSCPDGEGCCCDAPALGRGSHAQPRGLNSHTRCGCKLTNLHMITRVIMSIILNMSTVMARLQFRTLLMARASIWIAGAITAVALPMAVYQRTGRADLAALLAGFIVTPYIVVGLFAGALADRHRIRSVALLTTSACALAFGSIPVAQMLGVLTTPHLFVSALVANTALVFFDAAMFAALPAIVGRDRIAEAFASMTAVSTVIGLGGPALGGLIAGWWSPEYALTISAVMFVVSAVVFLILDEPVRELSHRETTILRDIGAGLGFIVRNRIVRSLTLLGLGNSIAEGVLSGLVVVTVSEWFGMTLDGPYLGFAYSAMTVGGFLGALILPRLGRRVRIGTITTLGLIVAAGGLAAWSQQPLYWIGLVALVVYQIGATVVILNGVTERARVTPDYLQGRVNTTARMFAWGGQPVGAYLAAALVGTIGIAGTQRVGIVILIVTAGIAAFALRGLRREEPSN
ncbi:MAG: MFS transporter [Microbacterium sp.]